MLLREMVYKYDPKQPRDPEGKWSETGGGESISSHPSYAPPLEYPLASHGDLPLGMGAAWNDLEDSPEDRNYLIRRAERGHNLDGLIRRESLDELNRIANDNRFLLNSPIKVYWGVSGRNVKPDGTVTSRGVRSLSFTRERASRYAGENGRVFEINLPAGTRAFLAHVMGEPEVMMLPSSRFRVHPGGRLSVISDGTDYIRGLYHFRNEIDKIAGNTSKSLREMVRGKDYDPSQPRDEAGRWSSRGSVENLSTTNAPGKSSIERWSSEIESKLDALGGEDADPGDLEVAALSHIGTVLDQQQTVKLSERKDWRFVFGSDDRRHLVSAGSIHRLDKNTAEIVNLGSLERGGGSGVLSDLIQEARGWGVKRIVLTSTARDFYIKHGFTLTSGSEMSIDVKEAHSDFASARWECLRAKALAGAEWGKSFEGHDA